uniref:Cd79b protein n=1 Tax=Ceratias holboelli TaxID=206108 RepID=A0A7S8WIA5_9TELE|nr:Cd79b protein [Ceratias holboelli]
MRCSLAGYYCGLTLIHMSVAPNDALRISQRPRFYGVRTRQSVRIYCQSSEQRQEATAHWYKVNEYNEEPEKRKEVKAGERIKTLTMDLTTGGYLYIHAVRVVDRGVYFCKINNTWGPGTELQVAGPLSLAHALFRTKMKDGLILAQGLLLAVCIAAILLRKHKLSEKRDDIYEEPENDHIYEGLATETRGGGLYEELSVYAQPEGAEAPWE